MDWKKKPNKDLSDLVCRNTGMTETDLLDDKRTYHIRDMDKAVEVVKRELRKGSKVTIVGDYDVDGVTSSDILDITFRKLGVKPTVRIPRRFSEGYGLNPKIIDEVDSGLLVTVDNGIAAFDAIKKAKEKGLTVIVIDHHLAAEDGSIPEADVIVDPNAVEGSDFNGYCGAGLAYRFSQEFPETKDIQKTLEALACIGTICDVMPLTWENRRIVKNGLKTITARKDLTVGLRALIEAANLQGDITAENIAFKIGPMLNAPGRLYDNGAAKSAALLSFNGSPEGAAKMAQEINEDNNKRKDLTALYQERIEANISANCLFGDIPMVIYEPDLNEGLIGILAGKCSEKYRVPAIVFTNAEGPDGEKFLKGSGRSPAGYNLKEMLDNVSHLLLGYGGHKGAAGVRIAEENLEDFRYAMSCEAEKVEVHDDEDRVMLYDFEIKPTEVEKAYAEMQKFAPYGTDNPMPVYRINSLRLYPSTTGYYRTMGDNEQHIKLFGNNCDIVGFDMAEKYHETGDTRVIDLLGTIGTNTFFGKTKLQITMSDFRDAAKKKEPTLLAKTLLQMASDRY